LQHLARKLGNRLIAGIAVYTGETHPFRERMRDDPRRPLAGRWILVTPAGSTRIEPAEDEQMRPLIGTGPAGRPRAGISRLPQVRPRRW
jgi:hypothetical protein